MRVVVRPNDVHARVELENRRRGAFEKRAEELLRAGGILRQRRGFALEEHVSSHCGR